MPKENEGVEVDLTKDKIDDDIQIEIEGQDDVRSPLDRAIDKQTDSPALAVEDLRRQLADAQRQTREQATARVDAERRASEAGSTAVKNRDDAFVAYETAATNGIKAGEAALEQAKLAFKNAAESADYGKMAEAQAEIADATMQVRQAKSYLGQVQDAKKQVAARDEAGRKAAEQQAQNPANNTTSSRSQEWIGKHPQFNSDPSFQRKTVIASLKAQDQGIAVDSDAYFEFVEKELGLRVKDTDVVEDRRPTNSTAAAPTRGSASNGGNPGPQKVRLTAAELEAAAISGQTPQQYAKAKLALVAEGKMGRTAV